MKEETREEEQARIKGMAEEEMVNNTVCKGFAVVYLMGDIGFLKCDEFGIVTYPLKDAFTTSMEELTSKLMGDEGRAVRKEMEDLHPIVIHLPVEEERTKLLLHPYLIGTCYLKGTYLSTMGVAVTKELTLPFKAFDLTQDVFASVGIERQEDAMGREELVQGDVSGEEF